MVDLHLSKRKKIALTMVDLCGPLSSFDLITFILSHT